ncbi:MAG: GH12, partial [uncultured Actinomycetospora sp.]
DGADGADGVGTRAGDRPVDRRRGDRRAGRGGAARRRGQQRGGARPDLRAVRVVPAGRGHLRRPEQPLGREHRAVHHRGGERGRVHRRHRPAHQQRRPGGLPVDLPRVRLRLLHGAQPVPAQGLRPREPALELGDLAADRGRHAAVQHRLRHLVRPQRDPGGPQHRCRDDDLAEPDVLGAADRAEVLRDRPGRHPLGGLVRPHRPPGDLVRAQDADDVGVEPPAHRLRPRGHARRGGQADLVPHQRPGGLRAVDRGYGPADVVVLGHPQRGL